MHNTPPASTAAPLASDHWVEGPHGRLFARRWRPAGAPSASAPPAGGAPLLLFHDSLGCVELWRGFPAALCQATGREVVAYDRPGFGRSSPRTTPLALDFVADEARTSLPALRAQLGLARYVALGHSVGGGMAAHCAAAGSNSNSDGGDGACEALVTIAAQACVEDRTLQSIREARDQFAGSPDHMQRLARYHGDKAPWVLSAWVDTWLHPGFADWSMAPALANTTCPVLALHGELDEYGTTEQPQRIARWAAGPARVVVLPGAAHVPHREQPEGVAGLVAGFLAGLPGRRAP